MIESLGILELACYARVQSEGENPEEHLCWNPFPDFSVDELRNMVAEGWKAQEIDIEGEGSLQRDGHLRRFNLLKKRFGLSFREVHVLFLAFLIELDYDFQEAFRYLGEPDGHPSWKLEKQMFFSNGLGAENKEQTTLRFNLIKDLFLTEKNQDIKENSLYLKKEVIAYLMEFGDEPSCVNKECLRLEPQGDPEAERAFKKMLRITDSNWKPTVFFIYGPDGIGKRKAAKRLADELGHPFWPPEYFGSESGDCAGLREKLLEASLYGAAPAIEIDRVGSSEVIRLCATVHNMAPFLPLVFLLSKELPLCANGEDYIPVELKPLSMEEQYTVWCKKTENYILDSKDILRDMSNKYRLTPGQIERCLLTAKRQADIAGINFLDEKTLSESVAMLLRNHFDSRAVRVEQHYGWNDLILPERQKKQLKSVCAQVKWKHKVLEEWEIKKSMAYGTGISLVFAGPPGTGKTMAAQVLAKELWMELYKVELASVVSKYVGETEKRLKSVFEQARQSQVILFFDEADVLFGKRTEVKDSGDKYSNMEAAFLLQEMGNFEGIVILATNLLQNMDEAFKRRMKFVIDFPFPDKGQRRKIWEAAFPEKMPLSMDIDLDFLAGHFELTGSGIKNAVYRAAFFAAEEGVEVGMRHLILAVQIEYEKSMGTFPEELAGPYRRFLRDGGDA